MLLTKKLIFVLIPLLVILIALGGVLVLLPGQSEIYLEQVNTARRLRQSGDYNRAVVYYTRAIEEDNTRVEAYRELAEVYHTYLLNNDEAIDILNKGYSITRSSELKTLLDDFMRFDINKSLNDGTNSSGKNLIKQTCSFNDHVVDVYSSYTFAKYKEKLTVSSENCRGGVYTVKYRQYNAVFEYSNTPEHPQVVDTIKGRPYDGSRPTSILVNGIDSVITFDNQTLTLDNLKNMGARDIVKNGYDNTLKTNTITITYKGCRMILGCNDKEQITTGSYLRIEPVQGEGVQKVSVTGYLVDVTTNQYVTSEASLTFREGLDNTSGPETEFYETSDGSYTVDLKPGNYTVTVEAKGYTTESFELYAADNSASLEKNYMISPELGANEIRFVLEWNDSPRDLDSHLVGTTSKGTSVSVDFTSKEASESGEKVATLDVDDRDGYGPETITLLKTGGSFSYYIERFSSDSSIGESGATIKIYEGNSSTPTIVTPPSDVDDVIWEVCEITDGRVENINGEY